jgi:hypothetical protein
MPQTWDRRKIRSTEEEKRVSTGGDSRQIQPLSSAAAVSAGEEETMR